MATHDAAVAERLAERWDDATAGGCGWERGRDRPDLAARIARAPARAGAGHRGRGRSRRGAPGLDRDLPLGHHLKDDRSGRSPAFPSTGRSRRPAAPRRPVSSLRSARSQASSVRCRSGSPTAPACSASTGGAVQRTGPGKVLGLPPGYARAFPGELRTLAGRGDGVLLFQQTAANLGARPGDVVSIGRAGAPPAQVKVDGVVDLPNEDSLFQQVGAPPGAQPNAPPDNVILLPDAVFRRVETRRSERPHPGARHAQPHAARQPQRGVHEGRRGRPQPRGQAWPAAGWWATTSAPRSTRRARTRSTRSCCSSSSASRAR